MSERGYIYIPALRLCLPTVGVNGVCDTPMEPRSCPRSGTEPGKRAAKRSIGVPAMVKLSVQLVSAAIRMRPGSSGGVT